MQIVLISKGDRSRDVGGTAILAGGAGSGETSTSVSGSLRTLTGGAVGSEFVDLTRMIPVGACESGALEAFARSLGSAWPMR